MLEFITKALEFFGTNPIFLGVCSLLGVVGFVVTLLTWLRTARISQILKYNSITTKYNKARAGFQKTFEGHRKSIIEDDLKTDIILKDILKNVEAYHINFNEILSFKEKFSLWCFKNILRKSAKNVDFNIVCNYLAALAGRLSKKEEMING